MAKLTIPGLVGKRNRDGSWRWYWQPSKTLRDAKWEPIALGRSLTRDPPDAVIRACRARNEEVELQRRERAYRGGRAAEPLEGRVVILVDDGLATGSTMRAAVQAVRQRGPSRVVVAAPIGAAETCGELGLIADEVICARKPVPFSAVGEWYRNFDQTTDDEVRALLRAHVRTPARP